MFHRIKQFAALTARQQKLFVEAWLLAGRARLSLKTRSFKSLVARLDLREGAVDSDSLLPGQYELATEVGKAVRTATRFTPWASACLVQALVARRMLQRRGIAGSLVLAAALNGTAQDNVMSAHAWVKCGELFICGEAGHEQFTAVSTFRWPARPGRPAAPGD